MKIKVVRLKDTHNIFISYKGYVINYALDRMKCSNNFCIEIDTEEEKEEFIEILKVFLNRLERLEF